MRSKSWPGRKAEKWKIRANTRCMDFDKNGLSGTVIVRDWDRVGVCRIRFEEKFVEDLGHRLGYGVSSTFPVFLRLTRRVADRRWYVGATYFHDSGKEDELWIVGENMPEWAKVKWHETKSS